MPAKKKVFPEIPTPACPPTHFTVEEARRAVLKVREEDRLAREAEKRARAHAKKGRSAA
jgi:hypothetical protein